MPIDFKTGNNHNFNPNNVTLRKNETRETLATLNKIELRYNTRKEDPHYPQLKSLYKWRSVFGYHLGGVIRQGIVKLAEVKRHFENAVNLHAAADGMRKEIKGGISEMTLDGYTRLYSTRDIIAAMKKDGVPTDSLKYLKYITYDTFDEKVHEKVAENDFSVRKLVVDSINDGRIKRHEKALAQRESQNEIVITPEMKEMLEKIDRINDSERGSGNFKRFVRGAFGLSKLESALATVKVKLDVRARWNNAKSEVASFKEDRRHQIDNLRGMAGTKKEIASLERRTGFTEFVKGFFEKREVRKHEGVTKEQIKMNREEKKREALEQLNLNAPLENATDPNTSLREQLEKVRFGNNGEKNAI